MNRRRRWRPRVFVLALLWLLPVLIYMGAGAVALYQAGWFYWLIWTLPPIWLAAWLMGRLWPAVKGSHIAAGKPLKAPEFWTPQDSAALAVVDEFRAQVDNVDGQSIADVSRYVEDARGLAKRLAEHYHADAGDALLRPLTLVEILAAIHLAVEDLEAWMLENVPASDLATIGQLSRVPRYVRALGAAQKLIYVGSAILNPAKLLAYPLWRQSGRLTIELRDELVGAFYQRYLRQLGYYLIEMYSGRLRGGSPLYRTQFGPMAGAIHASGGKLDLLASLEDLSTTVAVMGQVKAGKSSLINALMKGHVATTSTLPETRQVRRFEFSLPDSDNSIMLLDTPGYNEADVTSQQQKELAKASEMADIILLVMAANVSARDADVQVVRDLLKHYEREKRLRPPPIIAVLTHIDLLRPIREWSPPYDWRNPKSPKEHSIAEAVAYVRELFGERVSGFACVYTGEVHEPDASVFAELVPQLIEQLDHGHSVAVLKAFYAQLSRDRLKQLATQVIGMLRSLP